jgi:hypothetical protein
MKFRELLTVLVAITLLSGTAVRLSSQSPQGAANEACVLKLPGLQSDCPAGWRIVELTDRGTTIGNFDRPDKTADLTVPSGRATITVHPRPATCRDFKEWVFAATKLAPDAVQTNKNLPNKSVGSISSFCFTSPVSQRGWIYESYFFEMNRTPINLELTYQRTSQNASEYRAVLDKLVETLEPSRP